MNEPLLIIVTVVVLATLAETTYSLLRKRPTFRGERMILVDTSVLIDGRILDIAGAGFIPGRLVIPRSVLGELQLLADGADHEKRQRARNGLEVITKLQQIPTLNLEIYRDQSDAREGVDNRLLALAERLNYEICTVDYNLQKVAQAQGITTLNINELSQNLRALYLPGERIDLMLKQKGQEKGQAIGYASDGTMVVVDGGDRMLEQTVSVEIVRSLQTNSGKMMFAKLVSADKPKDDRRQNGNGRSGGRNGGNNGGNTDKPKENKDEANTNRRVFGRNRRQDNGRQRSNSGPKTAEDELLNLVNKQQ